jgi:hypothetical protein
MLADFPFAHDHPNAEAHRWVNRNLTEVMAALEADAYPRDFGPLLTSADLLPPAFRVAVLRASIERLPWYRALMPRCAPLVVVRRHSWNGARACQRRRAAHWGRRVPSF